MAFENAIDELNGWKDVAAKALRQGIPHPDICPKLKICGVAWPIPSRGNRVMPQFDDAGTVTGITGNNAESWPEIEAFRKTVELPDDVLCPTCGQPTETTATVTEKTLTAAFTLAARALREYHDLTPAQLEDLLAFEDVSGVPDWFQPLLRWANGLPMEAPELFLPPPGLDSMFPEPPPVKKPRKRRRRPRRRRKPRE